MGEHLTETPVTSTMQKILILAAIFLAGAYAQSGFATPAGTGRRLFSSAYASGSGSYASGYASASASAPAATHKVVVEFTMAGVTKAQFDTPAVKTAFKNTVATKAGVASSAVTIDSVTAARRRAGVKVKFTIATTSSTLAKSLATTTTAFLKDAGNDGFAKKFAATSAATSAGITASSAKPSGITAKAQTSSGGSISGSSVVKPMAGLVF